MYHGKANQQENHFSLHSNMQDMLRMPLFNNLIDPVHAFKTERSTKAVRTSFMGIKQKFLFYQIVTPFVALRTTVDECLILQYSTRMPSGMRKKTEKTEVEIEISTDIGKLSAEFPT